ncbi:glycosyltransferase family 1 protein [Maribellus sp. YY47]|uniref:glycosyltransferase family 4 protein n=1 Tax=Maribellus sp. YY47 TaxID=2929486 RepID=UPI0020017B3B|nr:glycosyltransferase family 1 protein [Maribellus sp. YY47]MCK3683817.1 glycosyltransferase family 4 protein [Maribellus sp. YY47]
MKIGYDAKRAFLNTSGLGNYSRNTLNGLIKYFPENHYTLFTPEEKIAMLEQQEAYEIVAPPRKLSGLKKAYWRNFKISGELKERQVDLYHGLSNELPRGIHKTAIPSLVTIHDLVFIRYPEFYKFFDRLLYRYKVKYACKAATKIIAISEQTKADIVNYTGTPPEKIEVIHQAISPLFFEKVDTGKIKEKYHLPDQFILAVGTIEERKNQLSILKALQAKNLEIPLVMIGNPTSYCNDIHKYVAAKNLRKNVIILKNIPEKDLAGFYQLATLSVYISVYEGFGLPVIEAMASGCPVITSNVSCLPETAGDAAVLCSPGDIKELGNSIYEILNNTDFRLNLIEKGKKRANEFQAKEHAKKLLALYTEIANKN